MLTYILFIIGFIILIKGADFLVDGSASIAKKLNISSIVIGLTIVAFGTSAPEFIVNIYAAFQGKSEIAIGNILGSNIANILLVLGISSIIYPITVKKNTVSKEIPLSLLAIIILGFLASDKLIDGADFSALTRIDGIILLCFFSIFFYYTFGITKTDEDIVEEDSINIYSYSKAILYILLGLAGLVTGGKWIVDGAVKIAESFHVSQSLIGLTVVAIGTSLPELATSAVAAYKKQSDIAIGNVVGSNIFNIFWVLGASSVIRPLPFNASSNTDVAMTIYASVLLFLFMFIGKKRIIEKWQGVFMVFLI
ncbi:MAG: calcium/sodium antiporter [Spirochaetia bacterium]|nr:calcium/sodium antiporter [Spirochaetia bacterium]